MSTPVDAERAWQDLQRIRVPQERVYDELERSASSGPGATYTTAGIMWLFIASWGLDLSDRGFWLVLAGYVALLLALAVVANRKTRVRLHRSRHTWRSFATFIAGMVVTCTTIALSGRLTDSLHLPFGSLIQATLSAAAFLLFVGPANRWAMTALRSRGIRPAHGEEATR
ncbi:hypothetical protein [Streptomyces pinistramenti]|uniref:hypothetical protein n=1 Tax=Streptomyces pinistramenti TaxID=2884812 RepID=UPI001D07D4A1|nr:hypothetical protein [Streptomyces pinistramenti]MCB5907540.1 hypothetical protein [Streptomyces pinistramenti]